MLRIYLFKTLRVIPEGGRPLNLGSPTTRSLFAYLALNRQRELDRRHLAFVFWPQVSEVAARRNLRQYLHRLRQALAPVEHQRPVLVAAEHTVQLSPSAEVWIDVEEFERQVTAGAAELNKAVALYAGPLLEDLYEDWIAPERERLQGVVLSALEQLAESHRRAGCPGEAVAAVQRMLQIDPVQEHAHTLLMSLYYEQGDRARAIQQFKTCVQSLDAELGVAPLPETRAVYEAIVAGTFPARPRIDGATLPASAAGHARPPEPVASPATLLPTPARQPGEQAEVPFVGREAELQQLGARLAELASGHGGLIMVQGEEGVGKTRLVQEALRQAGAAQPHPAVFAGRGREFETMMPYHPLAEALRSGIDSVQPPPGPPPAWMDVIAQFVPDAVPRLGVPERARTEKLDLYQIVEALTMFFLWQAGRGPVVLFLDDAHWADPPTWEFLGYLSRRAVGTALLVVSIVRMEEATPEVVRLSRTLARQGLLTTLDVACLSPAETTELAGRLGLAEDTLLLRRLYEETAGNPFFVVEMLRAMSDPEGTSIVPVDAEGRRPPFAVPLSIRSVIEARLDRLDATGRQLLSAAAAVGHTFRLDMLQQVAGMPQALTLTALEEWLSRHLVGEVPTLKLPAPGADAPGHLPGAQADPLSPPTSGPEYQFDHDLIRHVAYDQMSPPRRRWVHRRIAEVLETEPARVARDPAEVAQHFLRSDAPARGVPYLIAAGEQALEVRAYHLARQFGLQAVGLLKAAPATLDRREGQIDLNLQLALAYSFTGEIDRALAVVQETEALAEALGDNARLARTHYRAAQVLWRQARPEAAGEYARRALRLAEETHHVALVAASLRVVGRVAIATGAYDDAISVFRQHLELEAARPSPATLAVVFGYLAVASARVGMYERALEHAGAGVRAAQESLSPYTLTAAHMHLAFVHAERRDWTALLEAAGPGLPICSEVDFSPHCFMLQSLAGRAEWQLGAVGEGHARIRQALDAADRAGHRLFLYLPHIYLVEGWLAQEPRGPVGAEAAQAIQKALDLARASGDRWAAAIGLRLRAEMAEREPAPNWAAVETDLVESRDLLRQIRARPDLGRTYLSLRRLYERAGQMAWAVDCHFRATSIFEELGMVDELRAAQGTPLGVAGSPRPVPASIPLRGPHPG